MLELLEGSYWLNILQLDSLWFSSRIILGCWFLLLAFVDFLVLLGRCLRTNLFSIILVIMYTSKALSEN